MNAKDFRKAKGQKVYEVSSWNIKLSRLSNEPKLYTTEDTGSNSRPEVHITELTVATAGMKEVKFFNQYGEYSKLLVWFQNPDNDYKYWFTSLEKAVEYAKQEYMGCRICFKQSYFLDFSHSMKEPVKVLFE